MQHATRSLHFIALTLVIWVVGGVSITAPPDGLPSTYAATLAVFAGLMLVTVFCLRNALPTTSVAHPRHRTGSDAARVAGRTKDSISWRV